MVFQSYANELSILSRELTIGEQHLLRRLGHRGAIDPATRRLFLALLEESSDVYGRSCLDQEQVEILAFYLRYPEERHFVLNGLSPRTPPYIICAELFEHYLQQNNGRLRARHNYFGRRRVRAS